MWLRGWRWLRDWIPFPVRQEEHIRAVTRRKEKHSAAAARIIFSPHIPDPAGARDRRKYLRATSSQTAQHLQRGLIRCDHRIDRHPLLLVRVGNRREHVAHAPDRVIERRGGLP